MFLLSSGVGAPWVSVGAAENAKGCCVCVFVLSESRHAFFRDSSQSTLGAGMLENQ